MVDYVGQQLGNYHILRLLGTGGFAEVYLGEHIRLNTEAAIKVLHTRLADKEMEAVLFTSRVVSIILASRPKVQTWH
jgi:eukaryotic-like serine/threonine-protein kinase